MVSVDDSYYNRYSGQVLVRHHEILYVRLMMMNALKIDQSSLMVY